MGGGASSGKKASNDDAHTVNKLLEKKLAAEAHAESDKVKLLLLGAGESGKTTLFKQMKILYGDGMTQDDVAKATQTVYDNLFSAMRELLHSAHVMGFGDQLASRCGDAYQLVKWGTPHGSVVDEEKGLALKKLWADEGIQETWKNRSKFQIVDSVRHYFDQLDRIMKPDYTATQEDVLFARVRTTGIVEQNYTIRGIPFSMFDVGGQRNERRKWIHCFEGVTSIIFVAAINEYDQVLAEDETMNRMDEALALFKEIANSKWFEDSQLILFLNKKDLLRRKIKEVPIKTCLNGKYSDFPYDGLAGQGDVSEKDFYKAAQKYFLKKFLSQVENPEKRKNYHVTCATDTKNVKVVFAGCMDLILSKNLEHTDFDQTGGSSITASPKAG